MSGPLPQFFVSFGGEIGVDPFAFFVRHTGGVPDFPTEPRAGAFPGKNHS